MGQPVLTLADLLPNRPRAVLVGINPAPVSVRAGHYYQGRLGQRIYGRLREAGLIQAADEGWQDDAAVAHGVGFTDIVKRPTARASDVRAEEYSHGRPLLVERLERVEARLVVFTFKRTATKYFGRFDGGGFLAGRRVGTAEVFVMPGPMEELSSAKRKIDDLRSWLS